MGATANGEEKKNEDGMKAIKSKSTMLRDFIPIYIPGIERGLIDHNHRERRFLDFLKARPSSGWFLKSGIMGRRQRNPTQQLGAPPDPNPPVQDADAATAPARRRFRVPFVRKINWQFLINYGKNWIKHPMNMAMLVWLFFVAVGLIILGLLMVGLLDGAIPNSSLRKRWTEIMNQVLNALFTIMCLYQHPRIAHHLIILCRWQQKDAVELRIAYCKTSARRPHERIHMAFILVLLHLTCFSQYVLSALYWGWTSKTRPNWAENVCIGIGIGAPIIAVLWTVFSPLGRKIDPESEPAIELIDDEESQKRASVNRSSTRVRVVVTEPQWLGGLFDCWDDITAAYLSFFCTFCVFGWNMERLGFGNMYVHVITFILFCIAPLLVFNVAASNINNDTLAYTMRISGCLLCFCGLLYGGFWRIQMRKKFRLPGNPFCCGYPSVTDCFQWLFCWACSLAQEVRTGNFYEVEEDSFYRRNLEEEACQVLEPLPREGGAGPRTRSSFESSNMGRSSSSGSGEAAGELSAEFFSISIEKDQAMTAPTPPLIQLDENQQPKN